MINPPRTVREPARHASLDAIGALWKLAVATDLSNPALIACWAAGGIILAERLFHIQMQRRFSDRRVSDYEEDSARKI